MNASPLTFILQRLDYLRIPKTRLKDAERYLTTIIPWKDMSIR